MHGCRCTRKEDKQKGAEMILEERMAENFARIGKRCQSTDSRITNTSRVNTEYIAVKLLKTKNNQKIL